MPLFSDLGSFIGDIAGGIAGGAGLNVNAPLSPEQQQAFVNALMAQQGTQAGLINQLQNQSMGAGPNPALQQLKQATGRNIAQQTGMIASQKGINPALAQRQAAQNAAMGGQQAAGQAGLLQAQQQLAAQQQLQQALSEQGKTSLYGAQLNQPSAMQNAQMRGQLTGGIMQGIGSGAAMLAASQGGYVDGKAQVKGDSLKNDNVPAMLSPGEIVIPRSIIHGENPGEAAKKFVEGLLKKKQIEPKSHFADGGETSDFVAPDILEQTQKSLAEQLPYAPEGEKPSDVLSQLQAQATGQQPSLASSIISKLTPSGEHSPEVAKLVGLPEKAKEALPGGVQAPTTQEMPTTPGVPSAQQPMQDIYGYGATLDALRKGLGQQQAGLMAEAKATGELGKKQASIYEQQAMETAFRQHQFETKQQELMGHIDTISNEIAQNKINPNQYLGNMSTVGKLSTVAGLIMGGIGSGLTGKSNAALEVLNANINRDIDAQKANMGQKNTLLGAYYKQLGNMRDAELMTRATMQQTFANQLQAEAARSQDPIAQARAQQAAGQLQTANAQVIGTLAAKNVMMGSAGGSPEMKIRAFIPESQQKDYYKELQDMQTDVRTRDSILGAFDKINQINTVGGRVLSPLQTSKQVAAIKEPIIAALSKATAGRFTEADAAMIDPLFPAVGDDAKTVEIKKQQLYKLLSEKMSYPMLKSIGIGPETTSRYGMGGEKRIQLGAPVVR